MSKRIEQALIYIQTEIENLEREMGKERNQYKLQNLKDCWNWFYERGIRLFLADPKDVDSKIISFYVDRIPESPKKNLIEKILDKFR